MESAPQAPQGLSLPSLSQTTPFFGDYVSRLSKASNGRVQNWTQAVLPDQASGQLVWAAGSHCGWAPNPACCPGLLHGGSTSWGLVASAAALETIIWSFLAPDPTQKRAAASEREVGTKLTR